jgi:diguanylate cyclase (GGDEF)-like protein
MNKSVISKFQWILINLLVGFLFAALEFSTQKLSVPPLELTLIRPGGAFALVALYIWGWRALYGLVAVVIGIIYYKLTEILGSDITPTFLIALLIFSSTLLIRLTIGYWLLKRYVGLNNPLTSTRAIIAFILCAGPISGIAPALTGAAGAVYISYLAPADYLYTAMVWLTASTMGVLIVIPVMLAFFAKPRSIWRKRIITLALPMLLLDSILFFTIKEAASVERDRIEIEFISETNAIHHQINQQFNEYNQLAILLGDVLYSESDIYKEHFLSVAEKILSRQPHFEGVAWLPKVAYYERKELEVNILQQKIHVFKNKTKEIIDAPYRDYYFPIIYLEPEKLFGAMKGANVTHAKDMWQKFYATAETAKVELVDTYMGYLYGGSGTIFIIPAYKSETVKNFDTLRGMIVIALSPEAIIREAIESTPQLKLHYTISNQGEIRYSSNSQRLVAKISKVHPLRSYMKIDLLDSDLVITYTPNDLFEATYSSSRLWWLVALGLLFSVSIWIVLLIITAQVINRDREVKKRTDQLQHELDLRKLNDLEQQQKNIALRSIATSANILETLQKLRLIIESRVPDSIVSILLLSDDTRHLTPLLVDGLSEHYSKTVARLEVSSEVGSCCKAAVTGKPVIADNIFTHPSWTDLTDLAKQENIAACWSFPITSSAKKMLGTFAIYHRYPACMTPSDQIWIEDIVSIASIAIEKWETEKYLQHLVYHDTLTQLPNRNALTDDIQALLLKAATNDHYGAVLFIDLDNFKTLNDALGHEYGDHLLIEIASRLTSTLSDQQSIARWGGDEFIVLDKNLNESLHTLTHKTMQLANIIRAALSTPFDLNGYQHRVTCSIGISVFHKGNSNINDILKQADTAMYKAKNMGRDEICFYENSMQRSADFKLEMEKDLREAMDADQFNLVFQPIFDQSKTLIGAEALLRWAHPEKGKIKPNTFISLAESTGLIKPLSEWVINQAMATAKRFPQIPYIAINISPIHFHQDDFIDFISNALRQHDLNGNRIVLEITEGTMLKQNTDIFRQISDLQKIGIGLTLDDFGTGYSSLSYLSKLSIQQIKIDQSFVHDIANNHSAIIEAILSMSKHLAIKVVAEGVETDAQFSYLTAQGCDCFQGYLLGYPCSLKQFSEQHL